MNTYIHKTNHRLRVRSDYIKQHPDEVSALIHQLKEVDAIHEVKHKRYAGSVAISFDSQQLDCQSLMEILESHHWTKSDDKPSYIEKAMATGTKSVVKGLTGIALTRLVGPSVSRLIMNLA